jgi:hypothetical protein
MNADCTTRQDINVAILIFVKQPLGFAAKEPTAALFVRVPERQARELDRIAFELKRPKREIVSALLSTLAVEDGRLVVGHADLGERPGPVAPQVLDATQLAAFLDVDRESVLALAEHGELPGRKIAGDWRFSRAAIIAWLAGA